MKKKDDLLKRGMLSGENAGRDLAERFGMEIWEDLSSRDLSQHFTKKFLMLLQKNISSYRSLSKANRL